MYEDTPTLHMWERQYVVLEDVRTHYIYTYILYIYTCKCMRIHQLGMSEGEHTYNRSRHGERSRCSFGCMNSDAHFGSFRGLEGAPIWDVSPNLNSTSFFKVSSEKKTHHDYQTQINFWSIKHVNRTQGHDLTHTHTHTHTYIHTYIISQRLIYILRTAPHIIVSAFVWCWR